VVDAVTADNWTPAQWPYAAVMDMQARLDPVRMTRFAEDWRRAVDRIEEVLVDLNRRVEAHIDRSWRGDGADASADSVRRYVDRSLAGLAPCRSVAVHLSELSTAASDLRSASAGFTAEALDSALAEVRQRYSAPAVAAGNAVEDIPAPPDPFATAAQRPTRALPGVAPQRTAPSGVTPPSAATRTGPAPFVSESSSGAPAAVHPSSFTPGADQDPVWHRSTHSSVRPDAPLSLDSPATTSGAPASTEARAGAAQPAGLTPRMTSPTSPVAPYLGGMYPGHTGRDQGGEHRVASYLISAGNTNELIGELPLVAPPVIGE
jgi:hypothetical protein